MLLYPVGLGVLNFGSSFYHHLYIVYGSSDTKMVVSEHWCTFALACIDLSNQLSGVHYRALLTETCLLASVQMQILIHLATEK